MVIQSGNLLSKRVADLLACPGKTRNRSGGTAEASANQIAGNWWRTQVYFS